MFFRLTPARVILLAYSVVTLIGTLLLLLPISNVHGEFQKPIDALFMTVSALAVTGLGVVDVGSYYSLFGQIVMLVLIQIGGLGYMTMVTLAALMIGKKIGLKDRLTLQTELNQFGIGGLITFARTIAVIYFSMEILGALLLFLLWLGPMGLQKAGYYSIFLSISAFNSAGFFLMPDNLMSFRNDLPVNLIVSILIIVGGLGAIVTIELLHHLKQIASQLKENSFRPRALFFIPSWSLHTKVALSATFILYIAGTALYFFLEPSLQKYVEGERLMISFFQTVNSRSGGFNTIDVSQLSPFNLGLSTFLMFVGVGSNSTGGGIRVTTLAVILAACWAVIAGKPRVEMFKRTISSEIVNKAFTIFLVSVLWIAIVSLIIVENQKTLNPMFTLYDVASAFGTVGQSTGVTAQLNDLGKVLISITMLFGRVGVLTFMIALLQQPQRPDFTYPGERIMVG